ncbi:hypothetical protein CVT26_012085 [Gymnopilus dilepis]|uniref:Uncharacterized protein n=1 Tax=Gymnopilus dilepis TaxID=231916 RepID=A0A409XAI7_9AGAR|nr:hypothetical protein CVT26_012085 [Gymnopilus dilepis]
MATHLLFNQLLKRTPLKESPASITITVTFVVGSRHTDSTDLRRPVLLPSWHPMFWLLTQHIHIPVFTLTLNPLTPTSLRSPWVIDSVMTRYTHLGMSRSLNLPRHNQKLDVGLELLQKQGLYTPKNYLELGP